MSLTITTIVCAYNESRLLSGCLYSLRSQTRPPDEILVINNNANRRYIRGSPANLGSLPRQPTVDSEHKQPSWERVLSRPNIGNLHLPLVSASSS